MNIDRFPLDVITADSFVDVTGVILPISINSPTDLSSMAICGLVYGRAQE